MELKLKEMKWTEWQIGLAPHDVCMKCWTPLVLGVRVTVINVQNGEKPVSALYCVGCGQRMWGLRHMRNFDEAIFCEGVKATVERFHAELIGKSDNQLKSFMNSDLGETHAG
jgi:hypothetical protein